MHLFFTANIQTIIFTMCRTQMQMFPLKATFSSILFGFWSGSQRHVMAKVWQVHNLLTTELWFIWLHSIFFEDLYFHWKIIFRFNHIYSMQHTDVDVSCKTTFSWFVLDFWTVCHLNGSQRHVLFVAILW